MSKMRFSKMSKRRRQKSLIYLTMLCMGLITLVSSCNDDDSPSNLNPVSVFTPSLTTANVGQEITFTDGSTDEDGEIVEWLWNFGNGTNSTDQNPTKSYDSEGTFTVTLTVTDNFGATNESSQDIIVMEGMIGVSFTTSVEVDSVTNGDFLLARTFTDSIYFAGMEIQFTDASGVGNAATANFNWDFGDGTTSIEQNPTHTYTQGADSYTVTLSITDEMNATGSFSKTIHIPGAKWTVDGHDYETMSPAIDNAGNVYVGTRAGIIQKFDGQTGSELWSLDIGKGDGVRGSPALSDDESTIYIGSRADNFHAINTSTGQSIWSYNVNGNVDKSGPAIDPNGNVYVGTDRGILYAFSASGDSLWSYNGHDGDINSNPLYHDNKVITADDSVIYALNAADGSLAWSYVMNFPETSTRARFEGGFAIDQSGTMYATYQDFGFGELIALNTSNGNEIWRTELPADARANSPLLSPDETIVYLGTEDGLDQESVFYTAHNTADGSLIWSVSNVANPTGEYKVSGALGSTGTIYVPAVDDYYYLLDSKTGDRMAQIRLTDSEDFPSVVPGIGDDGTIYWGTRAQKFFALYFFGELESLPATGWPVRGGDNKNRNRLR